jgi:cobalt-zinc-cadmium resistance protein CzcA
VRRLFIATPTGQQVPLEQVATVELREGPNQIQRDDARRYISVAFNVRGRDVESVVQELQEVLNQQLKLAPGYYITYGGQFENLRAATSRLMVAVPVALLLILVLLYFTFRSISQSVLIFSAIPLSAIGGVVALWLRDMPFSISAGVGFIALFGVAVLNGIVLIGQFNHLKEDGETNLLRRIRLGTEARLRPVLMTATVASLGFLPMALAQSSGAEVQRPLATVVIGGLVSATLLTLLVLPVLYYLLEHRAERKTPRPKADKALPLGAAIVLLLLIDSSAHAQQSGVFTSAQAVQQALLANGTVQAAQRSLAAQQALQRTAYDIGRTSLQAGYGQINSPFKDNSLNISHSVSPPGYYRSQAQLLQAQVGSRELQLTQVQAELRREVRLSYEAAAYARTRMQVLLGQDSVYQEFLRAARLRFKTGESARLEPATAMLQQGEIRNQLQQARTDYQIALRQLQALLQVPQPVAIADSVLRPLPLSPPPTDTAALVNTPEGRVLQQQLAERRAETQLEQARGLPEVVLGYTNQSLRGSYDKPDGTRSPVYGPADRFHSVHAGVALPLLRGPQKARVQAARLQEQAASATYQRFRAQVAARLQELQMRRKEQQERLLFYEQVGLPQAAVVTRLATRAFKAGETSYSDYLLSLDRARQARLNYLDLVLQHNQTVVELEYLLGGAAQ